MNNKEIKARLHELILTIIPLLDKGESEDIGETIRIIEEKKTKKWISSKYYGIIGDIKTSDETDEFLANIVLNKNEARRKMRVEKNGLCLILGLCIEADKELV